MRLYSIVPATVAVLLLTRPASAVPPEATSLSWVRLPGTEECISGRALARAVERRLGAPVFIAPAQADLALEGRIERSVSPLGWRATVVATRSDGSLVGVRTLSREDPACSAIDAPLAVIIALMLDPEAATTTGMTELPDTPGQVNGVAPPPSAASSRGDPLRASGTAQQSGWVIELAASGGFVAGVLPAIGPGGAASALVRAPRSILGFELAGAMWAPVRTESVRPPGTDLVVGGSVMAGFGAASVCGVSGDARGPTVAGCAGLLLGGIRAEGTGFSGTPEVAAQWLGGASFRARAGIPIIGPLRAIAAAGIVLPFVRPGFTYEIANSGMSPTVRVLYEIPPVGFTMEIGIATTFGR